MQLSSQNLSLLLQEVSAMVTANRPIAAGLFELGDRSLGRLGRVAGQLARRLEAGESAESAFSSVSGKSSAEVSTAFRLLEKVGSAAPIRCVAKSIQRRSETRTQLAIAAIYPAITILIAYCIVVWVLPWFTFNEHFQLFGMQDIDRRFIAGLGWLQANFWIPPMIFLLAAGVWYWWLSPRLGMSSLPGLGRAYRDDSWALFCDLLALEIETGVPTQQAMASAAEAAGDTDFRDSTVAAFTHLDDAPDGQSSSFVPPLIRWTLKRTGTATTGVSSRASELRILAAWYRDQAQTRHRFWIEWFPMLAAVMVLLTLILFVLMTMVMPLYSVLLFMGVAR